jgi:ribonuclease BN (tRNA processing enzyme)
MYRMVDYLQTTHLDIYLTHGHPDHVWGLAMLEFVFWRKKLRNAIARESKERVLPTRFDVPGESQPKIRVHLAPEHMEDVQYQTQRYHDHAMIEFVALQSVVSVANGCQLTAFPVAHRKDELCFGFRFDHPDGSLAYVTDTYGEPNASYLDHIQGVDVLLHDCCVSDDDPDFARRIGHSHITPVAQMAAQAQVGRLILVHLSSMRPESGEPELDRVSAIFPNTEVAYDRMEIEF